MSTFFGGALLYKNWAHYHTLNLTHFFLILSGILLTTVCSKKLINGWLVGKRCCYFSGRRVCHWRTSCRLCQLFETRWMLPWNIQAGVVLGSELMNWPNRHRPLLVHRGPCGLDLIQIYFTWYAQLRTFETPRWWLEVGTPKPFSDS